MKNEFYALLILTAFLLLVTGIYILFNFDYEMFFVNNKIETELDKLSSSITFIGHSIIIASLIRAVFNK